MVHPATEESVLCNTVIVPLWELGLQGTVHFTDRFRNVESIKARGLYV